MEKVQFQIESTLPELKDLDARGLFTRTELGQITARRTKWETALVKRVARKEDYLGYAQYEMGLERLRRARVKRLGMDKGGVPRGISGHSIVRRVLYILRRATDKFPYDLGVWLAYVDYARSEGMTKVVLQALTTALQLHPRSAALYILLSQHYLDPSAPSPTSSTKRRTARQPNFAIENVSPARKTLLLGLRFLPADKDLWREYIKLEVGWVEALRRRWKVLGIDLAGDTEEEAGADAADKMEADVQAGLPRNDASDDADDANDVADLGQNAFGASGEQARKAIIRGDLVITVLESAFRNPALASDIDFARQLVALFRRYPTGLRPRLLAAVYAHMQREPALVWNTVARRTVIERSLYDAAYDPETEAKRAQQGAEEVVLQGEALVSELGRVVKALRTGGQERGEDAPDGWQSAWNEEVGSWLLRWADKMADNQDLQAYLVASVAPLTKPTAQPTEALLVKHLAYIGQLQDDSPARPSPAKLVALAKSYTDMYPSSAALWTRRLDMGSSCHADSPSALASIYLQAMTAVGAASDAITVWRAAMEWFDAQVPPGEELMEPHWRQAIKAARKFVGDVNVPGQQGEELYAALLEAWVEKKLVAPASVAPIVAEACSTTWDAPFQLYPPLFQTIARYAAPPADLAAALSAVHRLRLQKSRNELDRVEAVLDWASWAMTRGAATGHVKSAWTAIEDMKREIEAREIKPGVAQIEQERIKREALDKLEAGWKAILARVEEEREEDEEDVHMD